MKVVDTICGPFDEDRYNRLRRAYKAAVDAKQETFYFETGDLLVSFTKYLLEFLEGHFKPAPAKKGGFL